MKRHTGKVGVIRPVGL